jgi:intracellular septation protein A
LADIKETLSKVGINAEALDRVRLAQGVVGKSSYVTVAALLALGAIAISLHDSLYLLILAFVVLFVFGSYFAGALWFAHKHPGESLLEGAELIKWRQLEMAAKDVPKEITATVIEPTVIGSNRNR